VIIEIADDSDGAIGDLARDLRVLHARACDAGARPHRGRGRWALRGVRRVPRATARALPAAAEPRRDPRQGQPPLRRHTPNAAPV
jgi:hypothetical protein